MSSFIDISSISLNKKGEELCGDKTEYFRTKDGIIAVLADGLGSGVKANILATLTSKIAITMLKEGMNIEDVVDTITHTLPICNVRKLAYSTFTIVEIFNNNEAYIVEFDNPSIFFVRDGKVSELSSKVLEINNKQIKETRIKLKKNDVLVLVSDGVIHAGVEKTLNLGWQWENVADYIERISKIKNSANYITNVLSGACEDLYLNQPGDDTTVMTIKIRDSSYVTLFSGPPEDKNKDEQLVNELVKSRGKKIVCGGTAANIVSRELKKELKTSFEIIDKKVPPIAIIEGIDLVTEGVLTLNEVVEKLKKVKDYKNTDYLIKKDGASQITKIIIEDCTHLKLLVGKAVNPAHQNPDFPQKLSIKLNVLQELKKVSEQLGKIVTLKYY